MRNRLGRIFSRFRFIGLPLLRSAGLRPIDRFLRGARKQAKLFNFHGRYPFVLEDEPFAMKLHIAADYSDSHSLGHAQISRLFEEFYRLALQENWQGLVTASMLVTFPDAVRRVSIDCRNTQFTAINRTIDEFKDGYEPELAHLIDRLVPKDGVFLDVGSNWGFFSLYLAARPEFHGRIHAFEPITRSFSDLRRLVDSLGCDNIITCYQYALSDELGSAKMAMWQGIHSGMASIIDDQNIEAGETVRKTTLDSLNLDKADFVKIDVEGHEAAVLRGAEALIGSSHPFIYLENWKSRAKPGKECESLRFLVDRGYRLYLPAWAHPNGALFLRASHARITGTLALVPFSWKDRATLPAVINVFACPSSREAYLDGAGNAAGPAGARQQIKFA